MAIFDTSHVLLATVTLAALGSLAVHLTLRKGVSRHVSGRAPLAAHDFAALFQTEAERALAPAVRDTLRRYITVDPALVRPDDKLCEDLKLAAIDGLDANAFVNEVEKLVGINIPNRDAAQMYTLRDIVSFVAARNTGRAN